ncbi:synaptogenesis protein syg-2-like [Mytilus galloprovincialis]|uniref:synaptogenesis protein syg-2-like n=1 Tax=Mytilus galloprovincialis TaxID=29158 RepID=UPI003F7BE619
MWIATQPGDLHITVSLTTYSAITGDSIVTILCKINGTAPAIAWDWTKAPIAGGNSEIISQGTNNARRQVINSATKPNLNIYSITEDDESIYRCRANNGKQQYISEPIILKVQEASLRKVPGEPQTNNALEIEEGRTVILTCSSSGGNPAPSVVWLKDSNLISTGTNSSVLGNVTTTTLTFVTTAYDNLEVYECQADNGFLQRPLVKTTYLLFSASNKPPGQPIITGTQRYDLGDTVTLSCSSTGGNPLPIVNWLRDDSIITTSISRFSGSGVIRATLTFVAGLEDHLEVFECQAHNDYLQNTLASTTYIELYFAPRVPTLTGPSTLISGSSGEWTCSSANGYPAPTLSMRIQDRQYTNEITVVQSYDVIDKSYTVAGTLNLVPSTDKTGQDLCCDVTYLFDNNDPQSTCLQLTINDEDEDNIIVYAVIGVLATLVLFVLLVVLIRYRIGREKGKDNSNSKYVSQQAAFSNQQDTADNSTHRDRDRDYEELDSNRREMHVYNTSQDNVEYSHYSTIPADHVFVDPRHTHPSILKQNSTNLQQDTTYLEPEHSILTPDNAYLEPGQTYFQPISGNSMTSTT